MGWSASKLCCCCNTGFGRNPRLPPVCPFSAQVLAALFESVPPARECSEHAPAKRQRVDDGSGDSLGVPAAGTLAACTVLRTPFSDFTKPTVVLLLHLLYNSHRAGRVARFAVGKPSLVSEVRARHGAMQCRLRGTRRLALAAGVRFATSCPAVHALNPNPATLHDATHPAACSSCGCVTR